MGSIDVKAGLDLPHLPEGHRLRRVLDASMDEARARVPHHAGNALFSAAHFGLQNVALFKAASTTQQHEIVSTASSSLLREAYFIEKLGLTYGAKMTLLAETTEERMLYALFGADEARHLALISPWLSDDDKRGTTNPFHHLLAELIEEGCRESMVFLIQVVLEGWGITHYRALERGCLDETLKNELRDILTDEARHHGSGNMIFTERGLSSSAQVFCTDVMARLLSMVRVGPVGVVDAVDVSLGGLSRADKHIVLTSLDGMTHANVRLQQLKKLMGGGPADAIIASLDDKGLFTPAPIEACV